MMLLNKTWAISFPRCLPEHSCLLGSDRVVQLYLPGDKLGNQGFLHLIPNWIELTSSMSGKDWTDLKRLRAFCQRPSGQWPPPCTLLKKFMTQAGSPRFTLQSLSNGLEAFCVCFTLHLHCGALIFLLIHLADVTCWMYGGHWELHLNGRKHINSFFLAVFKRSNGS